MPIDYFANNLIIHTATFDTGLANQPLHEGELTVFIANASELNLEQIVPEHFLCQAEIAILAKRKQPKAKREYLKSRHIIKQLLSAQYDDHCTAFETRFNDTKKELELYHHNQLLPIKLSLSHSHEMVAVALCMQQQHVFSFGIDLEKTTKLRAFDKLAHHFYHVDEVTLIEQAGRLSPKQHAAYFYRIWTLKEALAKTLKRPIAQLLRPNVFELIERHNLRNFSTEFYDFAFTLLTTHQKQIPKLVIVTC